MFNLIKMDLYKMFKSRSFYLLNLALIVIILTVGLGVKSDVTTDYETAKAAEVNLDESNSLTEEEYYKLQEETIIGMDVKEVMSIPYSGITMMLVAVFIGMIVCSEMDTGFIKNIIPLKNSRSSLIVSKNIVALIFILIQTAMGFGASILATIIISGKINILNPKELGIYLGFQILLALAFASSIILISYLTGSKAAAMSIGILLALNLGGLIIGLVNSFINISKIDITQLSIITTSRMNMFQETDYGRVILISIVYFILYNIISAIKVKRMEVN